MPRPPSRAATPRPGVELLARLTMLAQELAGAFRPASVIELVARALGELLKPDRLSDRKSTRLNSSHLVISYAVFCLKKKKKIKNMISYRDGIYICLECNIPSLYVN